MHRLKPLPAPRLRKSRDCVRNGSRASKRFDSESRLRSILERPVAVFVGQVSYSLYLWDWRALRFADWAHPAHGMLWFVSESGVKVIGAFGSYFVVERPMIVPRWRAGSCAHASMAL